MKKQVFYSVLMIAAFVGAMALFGEYIIGMGWKMPALLTLGIAPLLGVMRHMGKDARSGVACVCFSLLAVGTWAFMLTFVSQSLPGYYLVSESKIAYDPEGSAMIIDWTPRSKRAEIRVAQGGVAITEFDQSERAARLVISWVVQEPERLTALVPILTDYDGSPYDHLRQHVMEQAAKAYGETDAKSTVECRSAIERIVVPQFREYGIELAVEESWQRDYVRPTTPT